MTPPDALLTEFGRTLRTVLVCATLIGICYWLNDLVHWLARR
jgi:hypothetical protein